MGGIFYSILSVVLPSIFQLIYLSFSAHRIGREDFGSYAFLLLLITSFTQFSMAIPLQAYLRFYNSASSKENFKNSYRLVAIYLSALGACYTLLLAFIYGDRFSAATYLSIAISIYLICNFSIECQSLLLSLQRKKYFSIKIVESLAKFVFPILFYIMSEDPDFLIFGYLSGYLICNLPFLNIKSILRTKIRIEEFKEQFFYAYPIIFSTISSMIISFSDRFFIDIFLPKSSLGEYTLMYQFSSFAQVIGVLFSIIIVPNIMKEFEEDMYKTITKLNRVVIVIFIFLTIFVFSLCIVPSNVYELILSDIVLSKEGFIIFIVISSGIMLAVFQTVIGLYFVLVRKLEIHAKLFFFSAILNFLLNFYIEEYGLLAAALSTFASYLIMTVLAAVWLNFNLKESLEKLRM